MIQRYELTLRWWPGRPYLEYQDMLPDSGGNWVSFADHEAALEALREILSKAEAENAALKLKVEALSMPVTREELLAGGCPASTTRWFDRIIKRRAEAENVVPKARPMICEICGEDFEETVTDALEAAKEGLEVQP